MALHVHSFSECGNLLCASSRTTDFTCHGVRAPLLLLSDIENVIEDDAYPAPGVTVWLQSGGRANVSGGYRRGGIYKIALSSRVELDFLGLDRFSKSSRSEDLDEKTRSANACERLVEDGGLPRNTHTSQCHKKRVTGNWLDTGNLGLVGRRAVEYGYCSLIPSSERIRALQVYRTHSI